MGGITERDVKGAICTGCITQDSKFSYPFPTIIDLITLKSYSTNQISIFTSVE